jgi:hypothetical protein
MVALFGSPSIIVAYCHRTEISSPGSKVKPDQFGGGPLIAKSRIMAFINPFRAVFFHHALGLPIFDCLASQLVDGALLCFRCVHHVAVEAIV